MADHALTASTALRALPRGIWPLGFVSLFMDLSSEMIHALLPVYLVAVLGASTLTVGLIEGVAEATAMITKIFSGALSDWLGRRKMLAAIGYGLAAFTKPIFPLATTIEWILTARFLDRVGKGVRGAPRDALVADLAPAALMGASFGLRQSLDTIGAFLGPLTAIGLMHLTGDNYAAVFWIAVVPAFAAVGLMVFGVKEPERAIGAVAKFKPHFADVWQLPRPFWAVVAVAVVLTLARFSEAFLILRAQNVGLAVGLVPIVLVVMNFAYALAAYPAGVLSDRFGHQAVLIVGVATLVVADLLLALASSMPILLLGVVFWDLHMGLTQGLFAALVADTAPADLRGTAFGVFNLASGGAMLAASVVAGALWDVYGPIATFLAGAAFTTVALVGLLGLRKQFRKDFGQHSLKIELSKNGDGDGRGR
ncbi:MFS transporter [Bradyrhizobium sp. I71]|jgi:MFS family permease|uniref:MFS transporter n=1 Tax=Bradyrhizobium sp. I71 TaxID=2590772 RepID=UPI001EF97DFB|nr:MFS transporter [Bradyrhizobium sp. I71]ULL01649.1 MFS transporter [Bradyrhizobium sp. I71]